MGLQGIIEVDDNNSILGVYVRVFSTAIGEQSLLFGLCCWSLRRNTEIREKKNTFVFGVKSRTLNLLADRRGAQKDAIQAKKQHQSGKKLNCHLQVG